MNADRYRIYNETRQCLVAPDAEAADGTTGSADTRLFELTPGSTAALWISPFRDISPACAPIPLDLVYVNSEGVVLDTIEFFPMNGRGARTERAASVIALPADTVARVGTRPGDRLQFSAAEQIREQLKKQQNGNGHVLKADAPIAEPENADQEEIETGETDANWKRMTDGAKRKSYDAEEAEEAVENVDRPGASSAMPSFDDIESLLRQLRETSGSEPDGGGVTKLNGKKEEGVAGTPGACVETVLPSMEEEPANVTMAAEHVEERARTAESELTSGTEAAETNSGTEDKPAEIAADATGDSATDAVAGQAKPLLGKRYLQHLHGAALKLRETRIAPLWPGAGATEKADREVQDEWTGVAMAAEKSESADATPERLASDAADEGIAGQDGQLTLFSSAEPGGQLALFPTTQSERMPTGGVNTEDWGAANAPPVEHREFSWPQPAGSVAANEIVRPRQQPAIAGYEEGAVRVKYAKETDRRLSTAHSIFRSGAGANGHPDTTSAKRTNGGTNGGARNNRKALSNSFAVELPRCKVPGGKPNAEQVWGKRGVVPKRWIERMLFDDTPVRRSIQSLLLNDTATKNWILRWLIGTNPNENWLEDMLSTEVLDPRRGPRESVPGLIAYFFTGGPAVRYPIRDISASGLYLVTKVRWYEGTVVQLTLTDQERPTDEGSITVQGKVVRTGDDGVGFEMLLEGSPAHDGRYERHVPTNGVGIAQLGGLLRMIKLKQVREEQTVGMK